jgi:hypothetical protein
MATIDISASTAKRLRRKLEGCLVEANTEVDELEELQRLYGNSYRPLLKEAKKEVKFLEHMVQLITESL